MKTWSHVLLITVMRLARVEGSGTGRRRSSPEADMESRTAARKGGCFGGQSAFIFYTVS